MGRIALLFAIAVIWLLSSPARAAPHQVCLYLDIGALLWDASPRHADGRDFHEEYGRNDGPTSYPAQRWLARVSDQATGENLFGWEPLDGSGCAAFELGASTNLRIEWARWAVWEATGNQIVGYDCEVIPAQDCGVRHSLTTLASEDDGITSVVVEPSEESPRSRADVIMWIASFAEERFASIGEQPLEDRRIYLGYDPGGVLPGYTQCDRTFGNQPSLIVEDDAWRSKFIIAHEYGHQQTLLAAQPFMPADLDYCYPSTSSLCTKRDHSMRSHEWQGAAAIEGIASWYSVAVWNDVDVDGVRYVSPGSEVDGEEFIVPRVSPLCADVATGLCLPGVGNEWDWMSAFRLFRLSPAAPTLRTTFTMVSAAYANGGWIANGVNDAFWLSFDQDMDTYLGAEYSAWRAAAAEMELDR